MNYLVLFLKGFIIGIAKIMPGVSGAVLAISFGVYERILYIIAHPFKLKLSDLKFLFFLFFGAAIGIVLLCDVLKWCLSEYYFPTMCIFIGLIIGGIPEIITEISNKYKFFDVILFFISFSLIFLIIGLNSGNESNNHYFLMGFIESLTTIIPGISGTAIFMALGWYKSLLTTIKSILTFNCSFNLAFSFISGFIISTFLISIFMTYVFKKYKKQSYICILGFMMASIFQMISGLFSSISLFNILSGSFLFLVGYYITYILNHIFSNY